METCNAGTVNGLRARKSWSLFFNGVLAKVSEEPYNYTVIWFSFSSISSSNVVILSVLKLKEDEKVETKVSVSLGCW